MNHEKLHQFDIEKAIQAASVLLRKEGGHCTRLRLLKLLAMANRKCIEETARPLFFGRLVAMDLGPVHSEVYNLIKGERLNKSEEEQWEKHFQSEGPQCIKLIDEVPPKRLSRYEIDLLRKTSDLHAEMNDFELVNLTHAYQEWEENYTPNTSRTIPLADVIRAVGFEDQLEEILKDIENSATFDRIFSE